MNLVLAGGGTGGHIYGGVAIAEEFLKRSSSNRVLFIGSAYGLETRLVPKAGYELKTIQVGKLVGQSFFTRLTTLFQIPVAILKCMVELRKFKTGAVVGVGGFAAGPCLIAAKILGIPCFILEQNSVAGLTNQISAKLSHSVFLAFPEIPEGFPAKKCLHTGNPARNTLKPVEKAPGAPFTVFAFGGSQGATGINKLLTEAYGILKKKGITVHINHQTGEKDFAWVKEKYGNDSNVRVFPFIDNMQEMYDSASIVICRSGSGTISELGATGNAAIFIPFPLAAGNHQEKNALQVAAAGGARVMVQGTATAEDLAREIQYFTESSAELASMRKKMQEFYKANAAQVIIDKVVTEGDSQEK